MIAQALFAALAAVSLAQAQTTDAQFSVQLGKGSTVLPTAMPKRQTLEQATTSAFEKWKEVARMDPASMGFATEAEIASAKLGAPMPMYSVLTEPLAKFDGTQEANSLLMNAAKIYYPVFVKSAARASMTLVRDGGEWILGPLDDNPPARSVSATRAALNPAKTDLVFIVSVGALRRYGYFIGRRGDGKNIQDADPTKAATELLPVRPLPAEGITAERGTLVVWLQKLVPFGQKASRWSKDKSKDPTPPGPVPIFPLQ